MLLDIQVSLPMIQAKACRARFRQFPKTTENQKGGTYDHLNPQNSTLAVALGCSVDSHPTGT